MEKSLRVLCTPNDPRGPWVVAHLLTPIPAMIGTRSNPMGYFQVFVALGIPLLRCASLLHAPCLGGGGARGRTGNLMAGCSLGLAIIEPVRPRAPTERRPPVGGDPCRHLDRESYPSSRLSWCPWASAKPSSRECHSSHLLSTRRLADRTVDDFALHHRQDNVAGGGQGDQIGVLADLQTSLAIVDANRTRGVQAGRRPEVRGGASGCA